MKRNVATESPIFDIRNVWSSCYYVLTLYRNQKRIQRAESVVLPKDVTHYDHHSELLPDNPHPIKKAPTPHYLGMCLSNALVYTCEPSWVFVDVRTTNHMWLIDVFWSLSKTKLQVANWCFIDVRTTHHIWLIGVNNKSEVGDWCINNISQKWLMY
jgi:hypothetical protein